MPDCGDWKGWHVQIRGHLPYRFADRGRVRAHERIAGSEARSMVLFAMFFLVFLALTGFAYLASEAIDRPALAPAPTAFA
jgi:hypothetical protein